MNSLKYLGNLEPFHYIGQVSCKHGSYSSTCNQGAGINPVWGEKKIRHTWKNILNLGLSDSDLEAWPYLVLERKRLKLS